MGLPLNSHFGRGAYTSAFLWNVEGLNDGRGRGADGADHRGSRQHAAVVKFDSLMRCGNCASVQQHGDASLFHFCSGEFAKFGRDFGQDLVLGMNQADDNIFLAEISIKAGAAANELIDFAGDFYAAETRSHDDEAEMPTADIVISL